MQIQCEGSISAHLIQRTDVFFQPLLPPMVDGLEPESLRKSLIDFAEQIVEFYGLTYARAARPQVFSEGKQASRFNLRDSV